MRRTGPGVDIQQAGGGFQRLTMAALVFAGDLGAVFLLGSLSLAVILAQVFALVFLAFAPVALVVGVFPGRGHELFRSWILRLMGALLRKAVYSLLLAVVVTVAGALLSATDSLGWLYAFGLQAALYWGIFLKRHAIAAWLAGGRTAQRRAPLLPRPRSVLRSVVRAAAPLRSGPERKPFVGASDHGAHVEHKAQDRRSTPPAAQGRAPAGKRGSRTVDNSQSSPRKRRAPREGARPPHSAPGSEPEAPRRMPEARRTHGLKESSPAPAPVEDAPIRGPAHRNPGAHDDLRRDPNKRD